ncbi:hypothetical protein SAMN05444365_102275 [Micromonospora pattaloongensis]|uniref:Uncharacterized protein n=1 Tax=Micromonospora pattaloongensis TaxID=405436 RepID=A0A1H3JWC7_9ACTN|nr:hypothetical protein SAMN05444365_102275 [Micromonospora pattaloongensis]
MYFSHISAFTSCGCRLTGHAHVAELAPGKPAATGRWRPGGAPSWRPCGPATTRIRVVPGFSAHTRGEGRPGAVIGARSAAGYSSIRYVGPEKTVSNGNSTATGVDPVGTDHTRAAFTVARGFVVVSSLRRLLRLPVASSSLLDEANWPLSSTTSAKSMDEPGVLPMFVNVASTRQNSFPASGVAVMYSGTSDSPCHFGLAAACGIDLMPQTSFVTVIRHWTGGELSLKVWVYSNGCPTFTRCKCEVSSADPQSSSRSGGVNLGSEHACSRSTDGVASGAAESGGGDDEQAAAPTRTARLRREDKDDRRIAGTYVD